MLFKKKIKAGYTLIEVICVVSIVIITASLGIKVVKGYNGLKSQMECKYVNSQILNFINNSRDYCKGRNLEGKIFADASLNRLIFYKGLNSYIDEFYLPQGFKLYPINNVHGEIGIDQDGMILDACKIEYLNLKKGPLHEITICVGTFNVKIKK